MPSDAMCQIRRATSDDADAIARVHVKSWQSAYRGIIDDAFLDGLSIERRAAFWREQVRTLPPDRILVVAESDDEGLVGFADAGKLAKAIKGCDAELYAIYLLQSFRRRGIGRRLFEFVNDALALSNTRRMLLRVLTKNPYCRFYDALGGTVIGTEVTEIGLQKLATSVYAFDLPASR